MGWERYAKVGDRVQCVDNSPYQHFAWKQGEDPVEGAIYTVADIWVDFMGTIVFEFDELKRSEHACRDWDARLGYGAWRFRPVSPRKTDISVFTKLLNTAPAEVEEA